MHIATTRFGSVEVPEENLIHFKSGIIGFPRETRFALIPHGQSTLIAWLQSVQTPGLAFPVVSAHGLVLDYPDVPLEAVAEKAGIGGTLGKRWIVHRHPSGSGFGNPWHPLAL